jgi:hypothetical protein
MRDVSGIAVRASVKNCIRSGLTGLSIGCLSLACGTSEAPALATGGQPSLGGTTSNTGGAPSGSGGTSTGGAPSGSGGTSTGGAPSGGNALATGGAFATGGTPPSSGGRSSGGTPSGGNAPTGGTQSTGGTSSGGVATGGRAVGGTATGGSPGGGTTSGGQATGGANATGGNGNLAPATGALLGVFTPAQTEAEIETTETQIGRKWAIHLGYFEWSLDYVAFARADIAARRIPYVTVEPRNVTLDAISSGSQDSVIQSRAQGVKGLGGKVLLRFAHEMNGNWYPWDGYHNGADATAPPKYIAAFRHLHDVFASAGVTNVLWVFCPNVDSVPNDAWNQWANYYPGDSYVDWMCYDGYNWGTDTFASMTSRIYSGLAAKNKPIMLGETSTQDVEKTAWINAIVPAMKSQFPMLKALVWFDVNKEHDWRYDSSSNSLAAFIAMARDPYFNP